MGFWTGSSAKYEPVSTLQASQQPLLNNATRASQQQGAGGAFGDAADYYRSLLSDDNSTFNQMAAPEMRRFKEDIIPGLSEQFAGMGSGGLSSSGFRNAAVNAGTDLSERLGAMRANLRSQGAQGLQNIGQTGLGNYSQMMQTQAPSEGFLSQAAPLIGTALSSFAGPAFSAVSNAFGGNKVGSNTSPYGNANAAYAATAGR